MKIVIIGSGNVAATLGRKFIKSGHKILQVAGRNAVAASALAAEWDTQFCSTISFINTNADFYLIAVSDNAIAEIASALSLPGKVVAHTAGAVKIDVLKHVTDNYGVFYPLQSLRQEIDAAHIPIYTEASNDEAALLLNRLALSVNNTPALHASYEHRLRLHVAAVIVNNFINHIFTMAEGFCKKEGIDFKELLPIIQHTVERLRNESPSKLQTGPAARGDAGTLAKHEALLQQHPQLLQLYRQLSESILLSRTQ